MTEAIATRVNSEQNFPMLRLKPTEIKLQDSSTSNLILIMSIAFSGLYQFQVRSGSCIYVFVMLLKLLKKIITKVDRSVNLLYGYL
jgi:hypothetical protein